MAPCSPTVAAWELGIRLRDAREEVGMTGIVAARELGISQNFLSEVEHGKRRLTADKLAEATSLYEVPVRELRELEGLRDQTDERGWWVSYTGLFAPEQLRYLGLEWGAESIRSHESLLIPGLLQTEAYAHAIVTSDSPNTRTSEAEQRVQTRLVRQRRLTDEDPLRFTAAISEGSLKQQVGGRRVLADQLRHLIAMLEEHPSTLDLHVVPFSAGAHGTLGQATFHILDFASPRLPKIAWQESLTSFGVINSRLLVRQYDASYEEALRKTVARKETIDIIYRELKELT